MLPGTKGTSKQRGDLGPGGRGIEVSDSTAPALRLLMLGHGNSGHHRVLQQLMEQEYLKTRTLRSQSLEDDLAAPAALLARLTAEVEVLVVQLGSGSLQQWRDYISAHPPSADLLALLLLERERSKQAELEAAAERAASARGRKAANARHDKPRGARDKKAQILEIWASGKYDTKTRCAMEEHEHLGWSYDSAIRALRRAPAPVK